MIVLRANNEIWRARVGMGLLAADMGVDRATVVRMMPKLIEGGEGIPLTLALPKRDMEEAGGPPRKRIGVRLEVNEYLLGIREGWALDAYLDRGTTHLAQTETFPDRGTVHLDESTSAVDRGTTHLGVDAPRTYPRCTVRLDLPLLPKTLPEKKNTSPDVGRVFQAWSEILAPIKYMGLPVLTDERQGVIEAALKTYTADNLIAAIKGARNSPWHCGENKTGTKFIDLATIFKASAIDGHIARATAPAAPTGPVEFDIEGEIARAR